MPNSRRLSNAASRRHLLLPYVLVAPAVAVLLALSIYPLIYSITVSLQVGDAWSIGNFTRLASDNFFLTAMAHTFVFAVAALSCEFLLGLGLALLLNSQIRGRGFFRATLLVPMMLPPVVAAIVWRLLLNPNFGAINGTLKEIGINTEALTWTASPSLAMMSVIAVDVWQWTPFVFLVLLAGLQAIPQEPYEAALIDGSSRWQTFWHVTLPSLRGAIVSGALLTFARAVGEFGSTILVSGNLAGRTQTAPLYIFAKFNEGQIEAANAIAIVLALFSFLIFSVLFLARDWLDVD